MWRSVGGWVAGILATVIAGWVLWYLQQATPTSRMSEIQWGINYQGHDYANFDDPSTTTAGACSLKCRDDAACKVMTFVSHPGGKGGVCWLKDTVGASTRSSDMASALKLKR
jgi:hypothetical protein